MSPESSTFANLITFSNSWIDGYAGSFIKLYDLASSKILYENYLPRISGAEKSKVYIKAAKEAVVNPQKRISDMMKKNNQTRTIIEALKVNKSGNAGASDV